MIIYNLNEINYSKRTNEFICDSWIDTYNIAVVRKNIITVA